MSDPSDCDVCSHCHVSPCPCERVPDPRDTEIATLRRDLARANKWAEASAATATRWREAHEENLRASARIAERLTAERDEATTALHQARKAAALACCTCLECGKPHERAGTIGYCGGPCLDAAFARDEAARGTDDDTDEGGTADGGA